MSVMNSINTNTGAMVALSAFDNTQSQLSSVQKQISTGYRVSDATDDGAAYAVAQRVRSDVGALTTANNQLGNAQGLLSTTLSGLNNVSNMMNNMRNVLVQMSDGNSTGTEHSAYVAQYKSDLANLKTYFTDSTYNGKTLMGNIGGTAGFGSVSVIRNETGGTYSIGTFGGSSFMASMALTNSSTTAAASLLKSGSTFMNLMTKVGTQLNNYGNAVNYVNNQVSYNSTKISSLNSGLGSLVDADLAQESAKLQALQTQQQLGEQALSLANQAPSALLKLFNG
jgi:flagellin